MRIWAREARQLSTVLQDTLDEAFGTIKASAQAGDFSCNFLVGDADKENPGGRLLRDAFITSAREYGFNARQGRNARGELISVVGRKVKRANGRYSAVDDVRWIVEVSWEKPWKKTKSLTNTGPL